MIILTYLRLICTSFFLSSMAEDLKSLDLSYNELDEMPVKAMKPLKVLDWANFHRYTERN